MRALLTWLLLINYLMVVLTGSWTALRAPAPPTAAHPYVHSAQCQPANYLRLDCFDSCNGEQRMIKQLPGSDDPQHTHELKALDCHLPVAQRDEPAPGVRVVLACWRAVPALALSTRTDWIVVPPPKTRSAFAC